MRIKLWLCIVAVLCLVAGTAFAGDLYSLDGKNPKAGGGGEPNKGLLNCSGAVEIALNNTYTGTNVGAPNNVTTYGCSTWNESGGEVVYHLYLPTLKMWTASVTSTCDLDIAVLSACDEAAASCLIVVDTGVSTNVPVSGDFYFVIDGYAGASCAFTFTITEVTPPPPVDFCQYVVPLACTDSQLAGDTCTGQNLIKTNWACTGYTENGLENYYAITLNPGGDFAATVTFASKDAALYVFDGCVEPFTCLTGADDTVTGQPETVSYTNSGTVPQTVYLVIDSYGTASCGAYTGTFTCSPGTVATTSASWSELKTQYR